MPRSPEHGGPSQDKETLQQDLAKALARVDVLTAGRVPGSAWLSWQPFAIGFLENPNLNDFNGKKTHGNIWNDHHELSIDKWAISPNCPEMDGNRLHLIIKHSLWMLLSAWKAASSQVEEGQLRTLQTECEALKDEVTNKAPMVESPGWAGFK